MSDKQYTRVFLRRLVRILRRRPPPPAEGWRKAVLDLYPDKNPLLTSLLETINKDDPRFGWWKDTTCPTNDASMTGSKDS